MSLLDQIKPRVLFEHTAKKNSSRAGIPPVPRELLLRAHELQIRHGSALSNHEHLHRLIGEFLHPYRARPVQGSPFISAAMLARTGYDKSFPELLVEAGPEEDRASCYGTPAACHSVYQALLGTELSELVCFDVTGICSRNESEIAPSKGRLRHFTQRELVCIGPARECDELRKKIFDAHIDFCRNVLGISFKAVVASDPFCGADAGLKKAAQMIDEIKIEFVSDLPGSGDIAFASLNRHGAMFAKEFDLHGNGDLSSFCLAWGMERLALIVAANRSSGKIGQHD